MSMKGDVQSLTQKVHKMSQTLLLLEKGTDSGFPKLQPNVSSSQIKRLGFDDSCQEGERSRSQKTGFSLGQMGPMHHRT